MNRFLALNIILCLISLSCKAQVEMQKEEEPSTKIVDSFYNSIDANSAVGVSNYIKEGKFPVNYKPPFKMSPLELAVDSKSVAVIRVLIDNGLHMSDDDLGLMMHSNSVDSELFSYAASIASHKEKIDVGEWEEKYSHNHTRIGDYIKFRLIILYGFDFKNMSSGDEQRTELYISMILNEDWELLDLLDYSDEAFNGHTCYGPTVLTTAANAGSYDLMKYLLDKGLDKSVREFEACYDDAQEGVDAYEIAEGNGNKEMMDLLDKY